MRTVSRKRPPDHAQGIGHKEEAPVPSSRKATRFVRFEASIPSAFGSIVRRIRDRPIQRVQANLRLRPRTAVSSGATPRASFTKRGGFRDDSQEQTERASHTTIDSASPGDGSRQRSNAKCWRREEGGFMRQRACLFSRKSWYFLGTLLTLGLLLRGIVKSFV